MNAVEPLNRNPMFRSVLSQTKSRAPSASQRTINQLLLGQIIVCGIFGWASFAIGVQWLLPSNNTSLPTYRTTSVSERISDSHNESLPVAATESSTEIEKPTSPKQRVAILSSYRTR